ncbi:hypothetical protein NDU88_001991 [Pleurodeles waltl]|uniref:Uncharacterized protein n=1 Tax=Pleurodeles waltl TaxID=8319 RepID=A0AAV7Q4P4_PLEWA|nr:hypothetical protein NDU88_001991 [Pleurodeles waltl]
MKNATTGVISSGTIVIVFFGTRVDIMLSWPAENQSARGPARRLKSELTRGVCGGWSWNHPALCAPALAPGLDVPAEACEDRRCRGLGLCADPVRLEVCTAACRSPGDRSRTRKTPGPAGPDQPDDPGSGSPRRLAVSPPDAGRVTLRQCPG